MSNTYIADSTDDTKSDDTLIIIVNADGTLSVDPETLQKLIANQHHKSAISVVRVGGDGSNTCDDGTCGESDEDKSDDKGEVNSHVNLTVEGFYPPSHALAPSTQPVHTPVTLQATVTPAVDTPAIVEPDSGGADVLADPFSQMEPEELEKLETALQSEQAKQILGENVTAMLDMLSVDDGRTKPLLLSQQESVMMDHCYTSVSGPTDPQTTTSVSTIAPTTALTFTVPKGPVTTPIRGRGRGKTGRGRSTTTTTSILQPKGLIPAGATLVPLVKQLVLPLPSLQTCLDAFKHFTKNLPTSLMYLIPGAAAINRIVVNQGTLPGQIHRVVVQNNAIVSQDPAIKGNLIQIQPKTKVLVSKLPNLTTTTDVPILPSSTQSFLTSSSGQLIISSDFDTDFIKKKNVEVPSNATKPRGRGRPPKLGNVGSSGRGRGGANINKKQRPGPGRLVTKTAPDEDKARKLEEEMAAVIEDMDTPSLKDQFIPLESIHQESCEIPKKITVNKFPPKKPIIVKISKKVDEAAKKIKEKSPVQAKHTPSKPKPNRKSADSSTTECSPSIEVKSPVISSPVIVESPITSSVIAATPTSAQNKKYPKRENRKPPAHLVEALGPALFSTPDIIRRVSTDKPATPVQTSPPVTSITSTPLSQLQTPVASSVITTTPLSSSQTPIDHSKSDQIEEDLLADSGAVGLLDSIHVAVSRQEEQLLAEALMFQDLSAMHAEEVPQESENVTVEVLPDPSDMLVTTSEMTEAQEDQNITATVDLTKNKHLSQTSLSSYFSKTVSEDTQSVGRTSILNQNISDINSRTKVIVETNEAVVDSTTTAIAVERINSEPPKPYIRKLPPIELPATRSASKRAIQQKSPQPQEVHKKTVVVIAPKKPISPPKERRKSPEGKKVGRTSMSEEDGFDEEGEDSEDDNESYNSEDDPDRLWCICQKPHNNRFMICCDSCEEWFHGKCVGITKAMGQKMEQNGVEWSCPNCKKKKQLDEKNVSPQQKMATISHASSVDKSIESVMKEESVKTKTVVQAEAIEEVATKKVHVVEVKPRENIETVVATTPIAVEEPPTTTNVLTSSTSVVPSSSTTMCIVCKKEALTNSIYCGDDCINKHANESLAIITSEKHQGQAGVQSVIVFERKTGRVLAGPNAPTAANLISWLLTHPTFEVMRPGILPTSKFYNQKSGSAAIPVQPKAAKNSVLRQTVLNPRVVTGAGGKHIQLIAALPQVITPDPKSLPTSPKTVKVTQQQSATKSSPVTTKIVKSQQQPNQPHPVPKVQTISVAKVDGNLKTKTFLIKNIGNKGQLSKGQQQITSLLKVHQTEAVTGETTLPLISKVSSVKVVGNSNIVTVVKKPLKEPAKTQTTPTSIVKKQVVNPTNSKKIVKEEVNKKSVKEETKKSSKEEIKPVVKKAEIKRSDSQSSSTGDGPKGIRFNVCKALKETLLIRFKECPDFTMEEDKVENLAVSIEDELNALYKESAKYKNKFRSLVFNIKDPKNQTLFRKIADGSITPDQVVRLTSEEMASQELAQWREREARHQLEMIKKNELDLLQQAKTIVMKTHKGEQVIENEDGLGSKNPETSVTELESALNSNVLDEHAVPSVKEKEFNLAKFEKHLQIEEKHKHSSKKKEEKKRSRKHSKSSSRDKSHKKHRSRSRSRSRRSSEKEKEKKTNVVESESKTKKPKVEEELKVEPEPVKELPTVEQEEDTLVESTPQLPEEVESDSSDREPSSTVNIKTPPYIEEELESSYIWQGTLMMTDVAKFKTTVQEVSGGCTDLTADLPSSVDCVGRINPDTVWDYISKMKKSGTKEILVIRFTADNEEDKMSYLSLYSYLSSRNRMGVVGNANKMIKDFYVLPLASHSPVPQVLLPLDGPGFEDHRPHLLLGIIVRTRRKRMATERDLPFIPKVPKKAPRSYTPPIPGEDGSHTPPHPPPTAESFTPPYSPRTDTDLKAKKEKESSNSTVSDAYDIEDNDAPYSPIDEDTPYSPGDEEVEIAPISSPGDMECSAELQRKMDELNRRIEEQKKQIVSISSAIGVEPSENVITESQEEEAYSPSRSFTPPAAAENIPFLNNQQLPDIALPSNLQEILASIKKQPAEPKSLDIKLDPIVQAYSKVEEPYSPGDKPDIETGDSSSDNVTTPVAPEPMISSAPKEVIKVSRDPRQRLEPKRTISSLSQLSDEELIRKAAEMGFMNPENPKPIPEAVKRRTASDQPPPPGLEDEYNFPPIEITPPSSHPPPQVTNFPPPLYSGPPFNRYPPAGPPLPPPPPPPPLPPMHPFPPHNYIPPPQGHPVYQQGPPMPHIPFTNPQPPPPEMLFPPPQPPPPQLPPEPVQKPPPPKEPLSKSPPIEKREPVTRRSKKSEKLRVESLRSIVESKQVFESRRLSLEAKRSPDSSVSKARVEKRKYSESSSKDYDLERNEKKRDKFLRKRDKKNWDYDKLPDKRRESWEYDSPGGTASAPPLPVMPSRGGMRGRFHHQRGRFPMRRGFDRPGRGYHRGFHPPRGHPPGTSRGFHAKRMEPRAAIQSEWEEEIRQFEEKRQRSKKLKMEKEKLPWRSSSSPVRKRRPKDSDTEA